MCLFPKMNNWLKKKLSIGLSFGYLSVDENISIIEKYADYIHDIYFSPVESLRLQTRLKIYDFDNTTQETRRTDLNKVIAVAKSKGIKISFVLNANMVSPKEMADLFKVYNDRYKIDSVTTTTEVAKIIKSQYPKMYITCSYNEGISTKAKLESVVSSGLFDSIVLGNSFIRDFDTFAYVRNHGLSTVLLLNNGCSFGCTNFCRSNEHDYCRRLFTERLKNIGTASTLYALQTIFPEELDTYYKGSNNIDVLKLSSRPITYDEYVDLLESYISGESKSFIEKTTRNYHLYGRLGHFSKYYDEFEYRSILMMKESIWRNIQCKIKFQIP